MSKKNDLLFLLVLPINIFYYFETKYLYYINNKNKVYQVKHNYYS